MKLSELKQDRKAYSALITMWSELSRISRATTRKDLNDDFGNRYEIKKKGDQMQFHDTHSGDLFTYDPVQNEWN
jgi:hypothetical protein